MYSPDTLQRINDEAVAKYQAELAKEIEAREAKVNEMEAFGASCSQIEEAKRECDTECEYCESPADEIIAVYNPADAVRNPPVEGAYNTIAICEGCRDDGRHMDDLFNCPWCGETFIINHSWDVVAVMGEDGPTCQKCFIEHELEAQYLGRVIDDLREMDVTSWKRMNNIPGYTEFWSGEFSQFSDFPGWKPGQVGDMINEIMKAAHDHGLTEESEIVPLVTHGYQFSVVLGLFTKEVEDARSDRDSGNELDSEPPSRTLH